MVSFCSPLLSCGTSEWYEYVGRFKWVAAGADGKPGADGKVGPAGPAGPAGKDGDAPPQNMRSICAVLQASDCGVAREVRCGWLQVP